MTPPTYPTQLNIPALGGCSVHHWERPSAVNAIASLDVSIPHSSDKTSKISRMVGLSVGLSNFPAQHT